MSRGSTPFDRLPATSGEREALVVIETPKGSRNKYAFDEDLGIFLLKGVLPEGTSFPYDYGFIPATRGGDGDPLDILIIMDAPAFPGCVITARLIGAIKAEQTERDGGPERNDRLIGLATHARTHEHIGALSELPPRIVGEIEAFFEHYNRMAGKAFKPIGRAGPEEAWTLLEQGMNAARDPR